MSPRRVYTHLGRRGKFLIYAGTAWFLLGYSYIVAPPRRPPGTLVVHDLVPYPWWGVAWMAAGLIGIAFAWTIRPGRDRWGYTALVIMPAAQSASYAMSWILSLLHDWAWLQHLAHGWGWSIQVGDQRGWANAVIFLAIAAFVRLVAGWAEPNRRLPVISDPGRS